jgi:hypothetical protein
MTIGTFLLHNELSKRGVAPFLIVGAVFIVVVSLLAFTIASASGSLRLKTPRWPWFVGGAALLWIGMRLWNLTHPEEWEASISPDGRYEIRCFRVSNLRQFLPVTPGNGSDNAEGFVKLCDRRSGKVLESVFLSNLKAREPFWNSTEVLFLGDDGFIWKLPAESTSSQK